MDFQITKHPDFLTHKIDKFFKCPADKLDKVWSNLQRRETFVKGQIFPYRVEFDSEYQEGFFREGELNIHHGPFLSVHGAIGDITGSHRDLRYFYGSYILSFRLVRPIRLEFFKKADGINLQVTCLIKPWFKKPWEFLNSIFWKFFRINFLF
jgi:hypothetical protein